MNLAEIKQIAEPACHKFEVKRLDLFGSLARGEASADSDIDLLVEFANPTMQLSKRFFGLLHYLEDTLDSKVDLLTVNSLKNPYFREQVLLEKVTIYEQ